MSYDWHSKAPPKKFSAEWFDEIDRRFIYGARLFAHKETPFDIIIPFQELKAKRVLEIGCGMGLHTELMTRAGANVLAIDISDVSVNATTARMKLKGLPSDVRQMDAVDLCFPDESFDFVWSWGVIHHSAFTGRIVKQIYRVLRRNAEARVMVYNLEGMLAYIVFVSRHLWGFWLGRSFDEALWRSTDGYSARFYSRDTLADLFNTFFRNVRVDVYGQDVDAVPLP